MIWPEELDKPDLSKFPAEEFIVTEIPMADGGAFYRFDITGRTREHVEKVAALHGMTLDEWLQYATTPRRSLRLKIRAAVFPVFYRVRSWFL